jgi:hypothetical protein
MSGGGGTSTVQKSDPWAGVQPALTDLYGKTQGALGSQQGLFPGQTFAALTPLQQQGLQGQLNYAQGGFTQGANQYQQGLQGMLDAPNNIATNPAVLAQFDANRNQVTDWLTRDALPGIGTGAVNAGQYGGSRQGIAEGLAMGEGAKALANANASTMNNAYENAMRNQIAAATQMPTALQLGFTPSQMQQQVGGVYQGMDQQRINEAMQRYSYPEQSLWDALARASSIYSGTAGIGGTQTTTGPGSSPVAGAIGGAMAGAAIPGMLGPAGMGLMASTPTMWPFLLGGAALGAFS